MHQGYGYQLAAYYLVGFCGSCEADGFKGFKKVGQNAYQVRLAWRLDDEIRSMLANILRYPGSKLVG